MHQSKKTLSNPLALRLSLGLALLSGGLASCRGPRTRDVPVAGRSMEPSIQDKQTLEATLLPPGPKAIEVGRVVLFRSRHGGGDFIKRVVAGPGDSIGIVKQRLVRNERLSPLQHPGDFSYLENFDPIILGEDEHFVLGDNRRNSCDSRDKEKIGLVTGDEIFAIFALEDTPFLSGTAVLQVETPPALRDDDGYVSIPVFGGSPIPPISYHNDSESVLIGQ